MTKLHVQVATEPENGVKPDEWKEKTDNLMPVIEDFKIDRWKEQNQIGDSLTEVKQT